MDTTFKILDQGRKPVKTIYPLMTLIILLLSACASGLSSPTATSDIMIATAPMATTSAPPTQAPAIVTATPTLISLSSSQGQATASPATETKPPTLLGTSSTSPLQWDTSPEAKIYSATHCCGFAPHFVELNYIPDAQIMGDGTIIWTQTQPDGERQVWTGKIPQEELAIFLQSAVDAGFFGWPELFTDPLSPSDLPSQCIYIQLEDQAKKVCEYYKGAPQAFHDLYDRSAQGLGASPQAYIPEKGYLTTFPAGPVSPSTPGASQPAVPTWDAHAMGFSLAQAENGQWVEGPALQNVWEIVNAAPYGGTVQEGQNVYQLTLQIPGVSMVEPPVP